MSVTQSKWTADNSQSCTADSIIHRMAQIHDDENHVRLYNDCSSFFFIVCRVSSVAVFSQSKTVPRDSGCRYFTHLERNIEGLTQTPKQLLQPFPFESYFICSCLVYHKFIVFYAMRLNYVQCLWVFSWLPLTLPLPLQANISFNIYYFCCPLHKTFSSEFTAFF